MNKPEPTWRELLRTYFAATVFIFVGFTINSEFFDRLEWGWKPVVLLIMFGACQTAHWEFEAVYRKKYFRAPRDVLVQVKGSLGAIERIITLHQSSTATVQIYDKTVSIELKESK